LLLSLLLLRCLLLPLQLHSLVVGKHLCNSSSMIAPHGLRGVCWRAGGCTND
jgi:hypothetical protein